ncbi:MAG: PHP domain-containing protein [Ruminococcaceae bacterium]|nr:PHP domain-containing protein [Oscillospiraceae bacterium]
MRYHNILWDWNGTLIDDAVTSLDCVNDMLTEMSKPLITLEQYYTYVETPIIGFYKHILTEDELDFPTISKSFHESYNKRLSTTNLADNALNVLKTLKNNGAKQYIITATKEESARNLTIKYGVNEYFDGIFGADNTLAESKVERALKFFNDNNINPSDTVFIGDTLHDLETANALGVDCILVTFGHQGKTIVENSGTVTADSLDEILSIILDERAVDFHTHSTFSDGTFTPTDLINHAVEVGLSAIALTDHDTVNGINEAIEASKDKNIEFIPGIEFSVADGTEIHIIGLFIDHENKTLLDVINKTRSQREARMKGVIEKLQNTGFDITYREAQELAGGDFVGRAHIAHILMDKGYVSTVKEAFDKYIGLNKPCYVEKKEITPKDAITAIRSAGGLAFLAHLHQTKFDFNQLDKLLGELKSYGLNGIEGYYTEYTDEHIKEFRTLAQKHNLFYSGGSDFHGSMKPTVKLKSGYSDLHIPYSIFTTLKRLKSKN